MKVKQLIAMLSKLEPTAEVNIVIDSCEIVADIESAEQEVAAADTDDNTGLVFVYCRVNEEYSVD